MRVFTLSKSGKWEDTPNVITFVDYENPIDPTEAKNIVNVIGTNFAGNAQNLHGFLKKNILEIKVDAGTLKLDQHLDEVLVTKDGWDTPNSIYTKCTQLGKFAQGCAGCTESWCTFIPKDSGAYIGDVSPSLFNRREFLGFKYVSPKTFTDNEKSYEFEKVYYDDLSFDNLETVKSNMESMSEKAKNAADTRKYGRENCTQCVLKGACKYSKGHGWGTCKGEGYFTSTKDIIDKCHFGIKSVTLEERRDLSKIAYTGWRESIRESGARRDSYFTGHLGSNGDTGIIKDYYPYKKHSYPLKEFKDRFSKLGAPGFNDEQLAIYKYVTSRYTLGQSFYILRHRNFYIGIKWDGTSLKIGSATSTNHWFSDISTFSDLYHCIGCVRYS